MSTKRYEGAPFGIQTARFDISGIHPNSKMPGTYTQVPYCHRATTAECRSLAPGAYDIAVGGFSDREVLRRSQGPGWRRAQEVARLAGIPHMLYKEQWNHKKFLRENLGPGRYPIKDFVQLEQFRPSSHRGVCQSTGPRLAVENKFISSLPGPGSYGKGGIPSQVIEETAERSPGMVGMLECGGNNVRTQLTVGSHLAPGQYTFKGSINQLLDKTTGKRGPYDLFTGDRSKSARAAKNRHLGPGTYKIPLSIDEWGDRHHRMHGRFPQDAQYPPRPCERMYCSTLSQWPRDKYDPGPGHYTRIRTAPPAAGSVGSYRNNNRVSFGCSSERFNRQSQQNFSGVTNSVAVGQYSLIRWDRSQHRNGNVSVFQSATSRLPIKVNSSREQLLSERLHPKHPVRGPHTIMKTAIRQPVEAPC